MTVWLKSAPPSIVNRLRAGPGPRPSDSTNPTPEDGELLSRRPHKRISRAHRSQRLNRDLKLFLNLRRRCVASFHSLSQAGEQKENEEQIQKQNVTRKPNVCKRQHKRKPKFAKVRKIKDIREPF